MSAQLWIVGRAISDTASQWEFQGVFSTEDLAVSACRDATYFVGPANLDEELPHDATAWSGAHYPKAQA